MFRRALLAVAVLSYLICVLILSGGQKDIGPEPLAKLTSNLNVHVLNNESLHKKCLQNDSMDGMDEEMLKTILNSTSIQLLIKQLNNVSVDDFNSKKLNNHYAIDQDDVGNTMAMTRGRRTVLQDTTDNNIKNSTTFLIETVTNKQIMKHTNEKPNLENVITFWQTLAQKNKKITPDNSNVEKLKDSNKDKTSNAQINTNNGQKKADRFLAVVNNYIESKDRIEGGYLKNMLPEYISKQSMSIQTSPSTTSANLVSDDDTDIFKYLLNSHDKESLETHNINAHLSKYSYEFNYSKIKYENKNRNLNRNIYEDIKPNVTNMLVNNIDNMKVNDLTSYINVRDEDDVKYKKAKTNFRRKDNNFYEPRVYYTNHSEDSKSKDTLKLLKTENDKYKNNVESSNDVRSKENHEKDFKIQRDTQTTSTIPLDLIKQIAEGVKALILKDLHKVVTTTASLQPTSTKGTTESTTTTTTTTTYIAEKILEKPHILKKILEILEKYKTDDESTVSYKTHTNFRNVHQNTPKILYHDDNNAMTHRNDLPYLNPYYPYKSAQSKNEATLHIETPKLIPFVPIRSLSTSITSFVGPKTFKSKPIMLQTNLLEIPPLSIAVINPLPIIQHGLIESTMRSRRPIQHKQSAKNFKAENKKTITYKPKRNHKDDTPSDRKHKQIDNKKNGEKVQSKVSSVSNVGTDSNDYKEPKKRTKNGRSRYRVRTENNEKRLREKMEHFQQRPDYKVNKDDCCRDEIFTEEEQQHPVDDIKARDEASFKNLLRTQQRVTDMLALMLARTKDDQPLSVETA